MDLQYLRRLIKIFDDSTASDLTIEEEGVKIAMSRKYNDSTPQAVNLQQFYPQPAVNAARPAAVGDMAATAAKELTVPTAATETKAQDAGNLHKINSPIVGTFYRAPSPESDPFVEVGAHVTAGTTLCIIEAMKLMNEIESDISGTIVEILVNNAQPVEYNQAMFLIKPD